MTSKLTGEGAEAAAEEVKKNIAIFAYKQRILSIEMKTKVVQHAPRINLSHLNFYKIQILNQISKFLKFFLVPSFCLTFRHFLK